MTAINSNRAIRGPVTAVPVVAGKGVRLVADTENNRWVAEADETVLMDTPTVVSNNGEIALSEVFTNFERIRIEGVRNPSSGHNTSNVMEYEVGSNNYNLRFVSFLPQGGNSTDILMDVADCTLTTNKLVVNKFYRKTISNSIATGIDVPLTITKIIGVNRIASN
jgi:hypothetical protein